MKKEPEHIDEPSVEVCEVENDALRRLRGELDGWKDKYLRALADAENECRRARLDAENLVANKVGRFALDMLPLADNLRLALASATEPAVRDGLGAVLASFEQALAAQGITRMETIGLPLDPLKHKAVARVGSAHPSGIIAEELQSGYMLGDKVLREAVVAVAE